MAALARAEDSRLEDQELPEDVIETLEFQRQSSVGRTTDPSRKGGRLRRRSTQKIRVYIEIQISSSVEKPRAWSSRQSKDPKFRNLIPSNCGVVAPPSATLQSIMDTVILLLSESCEKLTALWSQDIRASKNSSYSRSIFSLGTNFRLLTVEGSQVNLDCTLEEKWPAAKEDSSGNAGDDASSSRKVSACVDGSIKIARARPTGCSIA